MVGNYNTMTSSQSSSTQDQLEIFYGVDDIPPLPLCIFLALQQFLMTFEATFAFPIVIKDVLCVDGDHLSIAKLIGTVSFVAGISTLLQSTFGIRLPVIQSVSGIYVIPIFMILTLKPSNCPYNYPHLYKNVTLPEKGSQGHRDIWERNIQELQGSLMVAALLPIFIGSTGLIGVLMRFIGPLTISPTLMLVSFSLMRVAAIKSSEHWYIAIMTIFLIIMYSQYLRHISIRVPGLKGEYRIFELFSVILGLITAWLICLILTEAGAFTDTKTKWGYMARTDSHTKVLREARWFYLPYPGQWGTPEVTVAGTLGMMSAALICCVESVGNYYASARLSNAPSPPPSAISRGVLAEGLASMLSGAFGSLGGTTTYASNVGALSISKVGSRVVSQSAGVLLIVLGCFGKFGALFTTIPEPVIGGVFFVMFGMIAGVGIANLQFVNLNTSRNLLILGLSMVFGLGFSGWINEKPKSVDTGNEDLDNVLVVLGGSSMLMGGLLAAFLDNTIPGTEQDRGIIAMKREGHSSGEPEKLRVYDIPFFQPWLDKFHMLRFIPVCPRSLVDTKPEKQRSNDHEEVIGTINGVNGVETADQLTNTAYH